MKKQTLIRLMMALSLVFTAGFWSCNTEDVDYENPTLAINQTEAIVFDKEGNLVSGNDVIELTTNREWYVESDPVFASKEEAWVDFTKALPASKEKAPAGEFTTQAIARPNTGAARTLVLTFHASTAEAKTVTITQLGEGSIVIVDGTMIYRENIGNTEVTTNTDASAFTGWLKEGPAASTVTYTDSGNQAVQVRKSSASKTTDYAAASGGNSVFFRARPHHFIINELDITGYSEFVLRFGISDSSSDTFPYFVPVTSTTIKLSASLDGITWTDLSYTNPAATAWVEAATIFKVPSGSTKLYIKFADATGGINNKESVVRVDDIRLFEGDNGATVTIGSAVAVPTVITDDATAVTNTSATISGSFTAPAGVTVTVVGMQWSIDNGVTYTDVPDAGTPASFSANLTALTPGTTVKYYAYAKVGTDVYKGAEKTFITLDPSKTYKTMAQVRAYGEVTITDNAYVKAIVINGSNTTSSSKNFVVSDDNAGIAIRFAANVTNSYPQGTEVEIHLQGVQLQKYNDLLQMNNLPEANVTIIGSNKPLPYQVITPAQLLSGNFESMYVGVSNVQVAHDDLSTKMNGTGGNNYPGRKINASTGETFQMYTATYSTFTNSNVPQGSGTLKGIASINSGVYQILPQVDADFVLTGARFLEFGSASLSGALQQSVASTAKIVIPYSGAAGTENYAAITATAVGASTGDLTVETKSNYMLSSGSGTIELAITGTPSAAGQLDFTVTGIAGLIGDAAEVGTNITSSSGGGSADFNAIAGSGDSNYLPSRVTPAGWEGLNVAFFQGGTKNSAPTFSWIGPDNTTKAMCLNGKLANPAAETPIEAAIGSITSPTLTGGIGSLTFKYGHAFGDKNGVSLKIEVKQGGNVVKTENFVKTAAEVVQNTAYTGSVTLNVSGTFELVITNNCPSQTKGKNSDRVSIWDISWDGKL